MPGLESWKSNLHPLPPLHPLQKKKILTLFVREHGPISKIPSLGMLEESFSFFSAFSLDFLEMKALFTYVHRKIIFFKKKSKEISSHHKSSTQ